MRGKYAKASARREVAQLEAENEELCAKVRKLEADLKDALVVVKATRRCYFRRSSQGTTQG